MIIAVDLDDTINHYVEHMIAYLTQKKGNHGKTKNHVVNRRLHECLDIPLHEWPHFFDQFQMDDFMKDMKPHPEAKEVLPDLTKKHTFFIITGRLEPHLWEVQGWLDKHFPKIFQKVLPSKSPYSTQNDHLKTKEEHCAALGVELFIDDDPNFALKVAQDGFPVLMIEHPWNKDVQHKNIIHVKDWHDIAEHINNGTLKTH